MAINARSAQSRCQDACSARMSVAAATASRAITSVCLWASVSHALIHSKGA